MAHPTPDYTQKPVTLLKDAHIEAISLVDKGANGHRFMLFKRADNFVAEDGSMVFEHPGDEPVTKELPLIKGGPAADEWKVAYSVVAVPGEVDIQKDVWDEAGIRETAHNFLRKNQTLINFMHRDLNRVGDLVESAIAPVDFKIGDTLVKAGTWYIGVEPNAELKKRIQTGEITGVSVQGSSQRVPVSKDTEFDYTGERPVVKADITVPQKFGRPKPAEVRNAAPEAKAVARVDDDGDDRGEDEFDYRHVPLGAEGPGIKKLQKLLNLPATGVYDEDTEDAFVEYLERTHPEAEPEPTLENLKAALARAKKEKVEEEHAVPATIGSAPLDSDVKPQIAVVKDEQDAPHAHGFDPSAGVTGTEGGTPKIGPMEGNLGVSMKLTVDSSSEDLRVALYQAFKQGDKDLIAYAKTKFDVSSAEHLLNKTEISHEALWYMYSRLVRTTDPQEGAETSHEQGEDVEKANPVVSQPAFTPRESLDDDAGQRLSKAVFIGEETCEKCAALPMEKACADHEITKADGWLPEGVREAELNDSDYAWLARGYKHGTVSKTEGRKLPYKVFGKVNKKGWKAAWAAAPKAELEGGPDLQNVREKLLRDIPKGIKIDRKLVKSAMFGFSQHQLANFTDKNGNVVHVNDVVKAPGGQVVKVTFIEEENGVPKKIETTRNDAKGNEVVTHYTPKQLQAVTAIVKAAVPASAGGSAGGHDPRKYGKIRFIVRSFGKWAGGKHSICVQRMKAEHPEVFKGNEDAGCAWLKDQWLGRTDWRTGRKANMAKGAGSFSNYLNADLLLKATDTEGVVSDEAVDAAFTALCGDLGLNPADVDEALEKDADGFLSETFGDDVAEADTTDALTENEQSLLQKFTAFLKGEKLEKSVEAPERPKVTSQTLESVMDALKLGVADALDTQNPEERAADLRAVVEDFGSYVTEHLAEADFVEGEAPEGDEEEAHEADDSEREEVAGDDVNKTGDETVDAEPTALEPRKKKHLLTSDSNMEENMEKSTDLSKSRDRLVTEAGTFLSEFVEPAEAEVETVEKEAPEGDEAPALSVNDVALFADKLADRLDHFESKFGGLEKSLGGKLDNIEGLAKSLDISDRITALEEAVSSIKGGAVETVEEVAKRVADLEAQPGHSTQAVEQREEVAKAAPAPLFAGKF